MPESTEADRYLLKRIAAGDEAGWAQLVARYQGRLLAFARNQLRRPADAEDLVQETFVAFLQHRHRFDPERSVETFLFTTLRRRIIDHYRGRASRLCLLGDAGAAAGAGDGEHLPAPDAPASWYVRQDEQSRRQRDALGRAVSGLAARYKRDQRLDDLRVLELLFYAQLRNIDVAKAAGTGERAVAVLKHRWLHELADRVAAQEPGGWDAAAPVPDSLLTEVWEQERPTCPKRSTLGRWMLGTLEEPWAAFVAFHVDRLGCRFCLANVADLRAESDGATSGRPDDRLFQSTIGFFKGR